VIVMLIALAGSAGAVTRFLVDGAVRWRTAGAFPWATLAINVTGSLLLGCLAGAFTDPANNWRLVVGVGFCGGYTTFSTASFETVRLVQQGRYRAAVAFGGGGLVACVVAAATGWALTS
jgi:CrcB protein